MSTWVPSSISSVLAWRRFDCYSPLRSSSVAPVLRGVCVSFLVEFFVCLALMLARRRSTPVHRKLVRLQQGRIRCLIQDRGRTEESDPSKGDHVWALASFSFGFCPSHYHLLLHLLSMLYQNLPQYLHFHLDLSSSRSTV